MGGTKIFIRFAVLAIAVSSVASLDVPPVDCHDDKDCPPCYLNNVVTLPLKRNVCSYCLCDEDGHHTRKDCDAGYEYSPSTDGCVKSDRCFGDHICGPVQHLCQPCYEGMEQKVALPGDCGYCLCLPGGGIEYVVCPKGQGWSEEEYKCVKDPKCCDPCIGITCNPCYHGMSTKFPAWNAPCSFCCCEPANNGTDIEVPIPKSCPYGEEYNELLYKCVPSSNPDCKDPDRDDDCCIDCCKDCSDQTCPPEEYGNHFLMPNPKDHCTFCCCVPDGKGGEYAKLERCDDATHDMYTEFDPKSKKCVKSDRCPSGVDPNCDEQTTPEPKPCYDCMGVRCPSLADGEVIFYPNSVDKCSYCCCERSGDIVEIKVINCGNATHDWNTAYNPATGRCEHSSLCPDHGRDPDCDGGGGHGGRDMCYKVKRLCPSNNVPPLLLVNPGDQHSFCQCNWGNAIYRPCAKGTDHFDGTIQNCV